MTKKIAYIFSSNYAGSHFLSLLMGSHSRAMHIGEVKRHRRQDQAEELFCYVCEESQACPMIGGIRSDDVDNIYDAIFNNLDALEDQSNVDVLIDTSKKTFWAERFLANDKYSYSAVHLIRDPRSFIRRHCLKEVTFSRKIRQRWKAIRKYPSKFLKFIFSSQATSYLYLWLEENKSISEFIHLNNLSSATITYHDLAKDNEGELARICAFQGLTFEPEQVNYWNFPHHGTQKPEYQWVKDKKENSLFDLRWQDFLTERQKRKISENHDVSSYLSSIGVVMTGQGLVLLNK